MDNDLSFEQVFRYRFHQNWALRNILVNYFVYWKGGRNDPSKDVQAVHEFIKAHGIFKGDQYPGIGRMLMIEDIFEEKTSITDGTHYLYPGLIPAEHVQFFETVVNEEYGLDHILVKQPEPYTAARFMWHIYHNEDKDGRRGHVHGSTHMLEISKHLFERFFHKGKGLEVSNAPSINGDYLLVKADDYSWPLFFISGSHLIDDPKYVFNVHTAFEDFNPTIEFPTICGTYFGDKIKEYARRNHIQLLQISSLLKFFRWVEGRKSEADKIAPHLDIIPRQHEVPIPVSRAIQEIEEQIKD